MEQVLINTPTTLRESWYVDGVIVDPGTVTVTITRADGTVLVSAAATTGVAAFTGDSALKARAYNLTIHDTRGSSVASRVDLGVGDARER
jgi:hypothetical protein